MYSGLAVRVLILSILAVLGVGQDMPQENLSCVVVDLRKAFPLMLNTVNAERKRRWRGKLVSTQAYPKSRVGTAPTKGTSAEEYIESTQKYTNIESLPQGVVN
jgi:hypothetical protein